MFGRIHSKINGSPYSINDNIFHMRMNRMNFRQEEIPHVLDNPPIINNTVSQPKKMRWGEPTWFFLHTLAEKAKPENFTRIKYDLIRLIYTICTNLPCPDCSNHAKIYLDSINLNEINSKDDLKNMLFVFHNVVNKRKGHPIFTIEELNEKYSNAVTLNIITNFLYYFSDRSRSPKMIAGDLHRSRLIGSIKEWLNQYLYCFSH